ncbi:NADH dehydrogenase 1 alpha subcomplex subunit 6 ndufa6 [Thoreauomyces humboldtii]|nr:NADH dehydrogenase 1 alpha subcomplex subunit 6 ndufa6 [Thoreauomyces humboldtii]
MGLPTRIVTTTISRNSEEQRKRVLQLFRDSMRAAPDIIEQFRMPYPVWKMRQRMREEFDKNRHVENHQVVDILLFKGRNELTETLEQWKQDDHVQRFFENSTYAQPERKVRPHEDDNGRGKGNSEFLAQFYEGNFAGQRSIDYA